MVTSRSVLCVEHMVWTLVPEVLWPCFKTSDKLVVASSRILNSMVEVQNVHSVCSLYTNAIRMRRWVKVIQPCPAYAVMHDRLG